MTTTATPRSQWEVQRSFDELGRPLRDITFCVVDLETTGGSAQAGSMIMGFPEWIVYVFMVPPLALCVLIGLVQALRGFERGGS